MGAGGILEKVDFDLFLKKDYWHREYAWQATLEKEQTVVRILSRGRNGVDENGEGDDFFVQIKVAKKDGKVGVVFSPPGFD